MDNTYVKKGRGLFSFSLYRTINYIVLLVSLGLAAFGAFLGDETGLVGYILGSAWAIVCLIADHCETKYGKTK